MEYDVCWEMPASVAEDLIVLRISLFLAVGGLAVTRLQEQGQLDGMNWKAGRWIKDAGFSLW